MTETNLHLPIDKPGIYEIPADTYHSRFTTAPALTSTGARQLVSECPAYFWHQSELNPKRERQQKRCFDIGTAAHLIMLEPDQLAKRLTVIDADDYKTKLAREARDEAYTIGKTPILADEMEMLKAMRDAIMADPTASLAFTEGKTEQTLVWTDQATGVTCKCRPDCLPPHTRYMTDYKTSTSANPENFRRSMHNYGYHIQAAWYQDGIEALFGQRPERFCFIVQTKEAPHFVSPCWADSEALKIGAAYTRKARQIFAECLEKDEWPTYSRGRAVTVGLPGYALRDFEERMSLGLFATPEMEAWYQAQAPI